MHFYKKFPHGPLILGNPLFPQNLKHSRSMWVDCVGKFAGLRYGHIRPIGRGNFVSGQILTMDQIRPCIKWNRFNGPKFI